MCAPRFGSVRIWLRPAWVRSRSAGVFIGIFWGAPLVTRELETGTFRLAWNGPADSSPAWAS